MLFVRGFERRKSSSKERETDASVASNALLSKERRREMKNPIQKRVLEGTKRARKKKPPRRVFSPLLLLCLLLPPFRSPSFSSLSLSLSLDGDAEEDVCVRDVMDVFCALFFLRF